MNKLNLTLLSLILTGCFWEKKIEYSHCESRKDTGACPSNLGKVLLPRSFPAKEIYIGFDMDSIHKKFLNLIIEEVKGHPDSPRLNILVPRINEGEALSSFKKFFDKEEYNFINILQTSSIDTIWAQDYFEMVYDSKLKKVSVIDLPYYGRDGEYIPQSLAMTCQRDLIEQQEYDKEDLPGNGDYGGNIEALTTKIVLIGNNLSDRTHAILSNEISQKLVDIDVSWLETGHVDELVMPLPHKKNAHSCEQSLLVASPKLALEIIKELPKDFNTEVNTYHAYYSDDLSWPDFSSCLLPKNSNTKLCLEFTKANLVYQEGIDRSLVTIQKAMKTHHGCELEVINIPQLFSPLLADGKYGEWEDRATNLNPNSVNNIFFNPKLLMARQVFKPFQRSLEKSIKRFPFKVVYVDAKFVHELNGGIHCATNILYGCE